ncbi:MAG TPA: hypothetical protein VNY27_12120 [Solirubrobacteraceae bacterium]|nr:hypothetical protein [Solirubrobacteraceae bacterium]
MDPGTGEKLGASIPVGARPVALAVGDDRVWVAGDDGRVGWIVVGGSGLSALFKRTEARIHRTRDQVGDKIEGIAIGDEGVWVITTSLTDSAAKAGAVIHLDSGRGRPVGKPLLLDKQPEAIAVGEGAVWVGTFRTLRRIDPTSMQVIGDPIEMASDPMAVVVGEGSVWACDWVQQRIVRLNSTTGEVLGTLDAIDTGPYAIAFGEGSAWTANINSNTITRLDARASEISGELIEVGEKPRSIEVWDDTVWVSHMDGTLLGFDPASVGGGSPETIHRPARQEERTDDDAATIVDGVPRAPAASTTATPSITGRTQAATPGFEPYLEHVVRIDRVEIFPAHSAVPPNLTGRPADLALCADGHVLYAGRKGFKDENWVGTVAELGHPQPVSRAFLAYMAAGTAHKVDRLRHTCMEIRVAGEPRLVHFTGIKPWGKQSLLVRASGALPHHLGIAVKSADFFYKMRGSAERSSEAADVWRDVLEGRTSPSSYVVDGVTKGKLDLLADDFNEVDEMVMRFSRDRDPLVRAEVASMELYAAGRAIVLGEPDAALAAYDDVISRFGADDDLRVQESVVTALVEKAATLGELGREDESIDVNAAMVKRYEGVGGADITASVVHAGVNMALKKFARCDADAMKVIDDLAARYASSGDPLVDTEVARGLLNKAAMLSEQGHSRDAVDVYNEVIRRFGDADYIELRVMVARARGLMAAEIADMARAIELLDESVGLYSREPDERLRARAAMAMVMKGERLLAVEREAEALAVWDETAAQFRSEEHWEFRNAIALALLKKMGALWGRDRCEEALAAQEELISICADEPAEQVQALVADSIVNRGLILCVDVHRFDEGIQAFDDLVSHSVTSSNPEVLEKVVLALKYKSEALESVNRKAEADATVGELIRRFRWTRLAALRSTLNEWFGWTWDD